MKINILIVLLILQIFHFNISKKIIVDYNEVEDVIYYNDKLYFGLDFQKEKKSRFLQEKPTVISPAPVVSKEEEKKVDSCEEELIRGPTIIFYILMVMFLTLFAGLMSGLTVGYLSVDELTMELREITGTEEEKKYSALVRPVLANRHWLLVTLLLMNSFAMEALPVFLDRVVNRVMAVVISVTLILAFGEVIPQAVCTGPNQVIIAAFMAPLTRFLMYVSWPLSFWIGKLLDIILGEHHKSRFYNKDLKALIEMHTNQALEELSNEEKTHKYIPKDEIPEPNDKRGINSLEANFMKSALEVKDKKAQYLMTEYDKVYCLPFNFKLNKEKIDEILDKGYSRIPVYINDNRDDIIGILRIKRLIGIDCVNKSLEELNIHLQCPVIVHPDTEIMELVKEFSQGKSHIAVVTEDVDSLRSKLGLNKNNSLLNENALQLAKSGMSLNIKILGIITLEDIIEWMLKFEILDEDDYAKIKKKLPASQRTFSKLNMMYNEPQKKLELIQKIENSLKEDVDKYKNTNQKENFLKEMEMTENVITNENEKDKKLKESLI